MVEDEKIWSESDDGKAEHYDYSRDLEEDGWLQSGFLAHAVCDEKLGEFVCDNRPVPQATEIVEGGLDFW